jgi:hypothetical protein
MLFDLLTDFEREVAKTFLHSRSRFISSRTLFLLGISTETTKGAKNDEGQEKLKNPTRILLWAHFFGWNSDRS